MGIAIKIALLPAFRQSLQILRAIPAFWAPSPLPRFLPGPHYS
jgi:hypothetical protein